VAVFSAFVGIFSDFGLSSALIQRKEINNELLSSVFWIGVLLGVLLTLFFAICAPLIAAFYSEPQLIPIIVVLSTTFFIGSLSNTQIALLTKNMNFKALAIISVCAVAVSGTVAVLLAFSGYGVWSLVWNAIVAAGVTVALSWMYSRWVPRVFLALQQVRQVIRFGANLTGFSFVNYFSRNLDNLLIGRFLGTASLGIYNLAYVLLLFPLENISTVFGRVMFPALSLVHDDKKKVRDSYIIANRHIASISFPLMALLFATAPQLVRVVYGLKWEGAIPLIQILALVGLLHSIATTTGWIFMSQGRTDVMLRWSVLWTTIYAISFAVGLRWNVVGVAAAYTIATYSLAYPSFAIPFRLIELKVSYFFAQLRTIILATLILGAIALSVRVYLEKLGGMPQVVILIIVTALGLLSYLGLMYVLDRELFIGTVKLIGELGASRSESMEDDA
jgi:O-antigen/teichoic acid export membrane protein